MITMSLADANRIIEGCFAKGKELGLQPLSVAVVDSGGHLVAFQRQDNSSTLRPQIALGKAAGVVALGVPSRKIGEMAAERPSFIAALGPLAPNGLIPAPGGVSFFVDSRLAGAVGVTGDTSDNDEICALAGVAAAERSSS